MFQPLFHNPWVHKSPVTKKPEQQDFPTPVKGEYSLEISVLCHNGQDTEGPVARGGQRACGQAKTVLMKEKSSVISLKRLSQNIEKTRGSTGTERPLLEVNHLQHS